MADGVLGLGQGQAATLNQELIDKLKEAERKAKVEPIETDLEDWEVENTAIQSINTKVTELLEAIRPFDLFVTGGITAFDQKMANTTGTSVLFDAQDITKLNTGTTNVTINSLATKDVFQTNSFSDAESVLVASPANFEINGETITSSVSSGDYAVLATAITSDTTLTATYDSDSNEITFSGGTQDVSINTSGKSFEQVLSELDAEGTYTTNANYMKINEDIFALSDKTHTEIAEVVNKKSAYTASIEEVGTDTFRMVIKSTESGLDNALTIIEKGFDLGLNQFSSSISVTGTDLAGDGNTLTLNGTTFTVGAGQTYADFISDINSDANFEASIDIDGLVQIRRTDGTALEVTSDDLGLNLVNSNHTLTASNMEAIIDGIDYDVSSNEITLGDGLKITATETGTSSINVQKDTASIEILMQEIVTKYNELVDLVDEELLSAESKVEDKSVLRTLMSDVKSMLFGDYGLNEDKNLFNFGFSTDKTGHLSLDSTVFNAAVNDDFDSLKTLFIGVAEKEGLGTQLKAYIDEIQGFQGLFTTYEESLTEKKSTLEEEKEKAIEDLDATYSQMAQQFADYSVIINQMEASFSGLKMMIQQSVSSN